MFSGGSYTQSPRPEKWMLKKSSQRISGEVNGVTHGNLSTWSKMRSQKEHSFLLVFLLPILGDQDEGLLQIEISRGGGCP